MTRFGLGVSLRFVDHVWVLELIVGSRFNLEMSKIVVVVIWYIGGSNEVPRGVFVLCTHNTSRILGDLIVFDILVLGWF